MEFVGSLKRWSAAISLFLLCIVWASLQWDTLRSIITKGPSVIDTLDELALLIMLVLTLGAMIHEIRQTATE